MDRTISTKDLKSKLDEKGIRVVETLAPERYPPGVLFGLTDFAKAEQQVERDLNVGRRTPGW
jgi:hypothetical protein